MPSRCSVPSKLGNDAEHADRAGDRRGLRIDDVAGGRDPIAARRRHRAHRDDDRQAARLGGEDGAPDPLRGEHRAARRIDPHHQRLEIAALQPALEIAGDRLAAGRAGPGLAVDDVAGDGEDADRAVRVARAMLVDPGLVMDRIVAAGDALVVIAGERRHALAEFGAVADPVDEAGAQGRLRQSPPAGCRKASGLATQSAILRARPGPADIGPPASPTRRRRAPGSAGAPRATCRCAYRARPPT